MTQELVESRPFVNILGKEKRRQNLQLTVEPSTLSNLVDNIPNITSKNAETS